MPVKLIWQTYDGDGLIAYMARVSNPGNQTNSQTSPRLISYLIRNEHWSPFEMVNVCFEIETTRDISRQIIRHRSFHFQEFSQRYAEVPQPQQLREARIQHPKNRQLSLPLSEEQLDTGQWWEDVQEDVIEYTWAIYRAALNAGVAKEQARAVLPEGLSPTRMYMNGTLRDWIHYVRLRTTEGTQKEHREIAECIKFLLEQEFPMTMEAVNEHYNAN